MRMKIWLLLTAGWLLGVPSLVRAANLYISPSSTNVAVGESFQISVMVDSGGASINAGEGVVSFSSGLLEYQSISTGSSIFTFWTNGPTGSAEQVVFGGGLSNPGYSGSAGKILTITLRAKAAGTAEITLNGQRLLANDGAGTNILSGSSNGQVIVGDSTSATNPLLVSITSTTHPAADKCYAVSIVRTAWSAPAGVGYDYLFNSSARATLGGAARNVKQHQTESLADGVWYLHVRTWSGTAWGPTSRRAFNIDTKKPEEFAIVISQDGGATNAAPKVEFATKDANALHYEASIDNGEPFSITSGDILPRQRPGLHNIVVTAIDCADNRRDSNAQFRVIGFSAPRVISWTDAIMLLDHPSFTLESSANNTVVVYLNDQEVERFLAADQVAEVNEDGTIRWNYHYMTSLFPGSYSFRFSLINEEGLESESTAVLPVKVITNAFKIGSLIVPTTLLITVSVLANITFSGTILIMARRLHWLWWRSARHPRHALLRLFRFLLRRRN